MPSAGAKYASQRAMAQLLRIRESELVEKVKKKQIPYAEHTRKAGYSFDVKAVIHAVLDGQREEIERLNAAKFIWNLDTLVLVTGWTERYINKLASEKGLPRRGRGEYDAREVVPFLIRDLRRQVEEAKKSASSAEDREAEARARWWEIKTAEKERQMVNLTDAVPMLSELVSASAAKMESWSVTLAPRLVQRQTELDVMEVLKKEIDEVRNGLADLPNKLRSFVELRDRAGESLGNTGTEEEDLFGGVGGPAPVDKSGKGRKSGKVEKRPGTVSSRDHGSVGSTEG